MKRGTALWLAARHPGRVKEMETLLETVVAKTNKK